MAANQNKAYKDEVLFANPKQVGIKDRLEDDRISGTEFRAHPMLRDNWGTVDRLRGVLGKYYVTYNGSKGLALYNYAGLLTRLEAGESPGTDDGPPSNLRRLRKQLSGDNQNTNLVLNLSSINDETGKIVVQRNVLGWGSYEDPHLGTDWFADDTNFQNYLYGPLSIAENDRFGNTALYSGVLNDDFFQETYSDYSFIQHSPSEQRALRSEAKNATNIESKYNFYIDSNPSYEEVLATPSLEEFMIPNAYYLQLELRNTTTGTLAQYHKSAIDIDGLVPWFISSENGVGVTENTTLSYYQSYSRAMAGNEDALQAVGTSGAARRDAMKANNRDLAVLYSDLGVLTEGSLSEGHIPFYNKIIIDDDPEWKNGFNSDGQGLLQKLLDDEDTKDFIDILQAEAILAHKDIRPRERTLMTTRTKILKSTVGRDWTYENEDSASYRVLFELKNKIGIQVSLARLGARFGATELDFNTNPVYAGTKFLRDYDKDVEDREISRSSAAAVSLDLYDETGQPSTFLNSFKRSLEEVYDSSPCHTETLLYIVEKYKANSDDLIQTFFISPKFSIDSNTGAKTVYYDSQIKFEETYRYKFKKVILVFGNEYEYQKDPFEGAHGAWARRLGRERLAFTNNLVVRAMVVPYIQGEIKAIAVAGAPPVSPEISFYSPKGHNSKVRILLNSSTGAYEDKPIAILESDKEKIKNDFMQQTGIFKSFDEILDAGDKIQYKSKDPVNKYQIFKIDFKPSSYQDFNSGLMEAPPGGFLLTNVDGSTPGLIEVDPVVGIPGDYIDTIEPNRKYYYCARSIDIHDNISNPTYIYEIEMVDNSGQIFLRQNLFMFESPKETFTKTGRRFIYIEPSFQQTVLEDPAAAGVPSGNNLPNSTILGANGLDQKIWNETMKIRLTSKKTGRKMDLNLTFKNTGVQNPSE